MADSERFVQISEDEARALVKKGEKVFVHAFLPQPIDYFYKTQVGPAGGVGPMKTQVVVEEGYKLQPEVYFVLVPDPPRRNGLQPAPGETLTGDIEHVYKHLYPETGGKPPDVENH